MHRIQIDRNRLRSYHLLRPSQAQEVPKFKSYSTELAIPVSDHLMTTTNGAAAASATPAELMRIRGDSLILRSLSRLAHKQAR